MSAERRQFPRVRPGSPVMVSFSGAKAGVLFDISRGGISVRGMVPISSEQFQFLSFALPGAANFIHARAEVAWTNQPSNRTGLRFLRLGSASERELKAWLDGEAQTTLSENHAS